MSKSTRNRIVAVVVFLILAGLVVGAYYLFKKQKTNYLTDVVSKAPLGHYQKFAISTDASECAPLAKEILKRGGNAVDSAITTLLCMALVLPHSLGLGGGSFITYYDKKSGKGYVYDGREKAGAFVRTANFDKTNLQDGPFSVAVPGELAVYWLVHQDHGRLNWSTLFEGPIRLARNGVKVNAHLDLNIRKNYKRFTEPLKKMLTNEKTGEFVKEGDTLVRKDLADTYQRLANSPDPVALFYNGAMAEELVAELKEWAGPQNETLTIADFADYPPAKKSDAITFDLDDENRLLASTLPSSGPILGFIMKAIAKLKDDLIKPGMEYSLKDSARFFHKLTEIIKHAYSRRALVADEAFEPTLTAALLKNFTQFNEQGTNEYLEEVLQKVRDSEKTHDQEYYGGQEYFVPVPDHGTAHMSIIDQFGNAISVTSTVNIYFGSGIISKSGIIFNDENDDFSVPSVTNYFGLPASKANLIVPGKRPASSMCPVVVVDRKTNEAKLSIGAAGGSLIISGMAQAITRVLYMGQDIKQSIDQWRFHHQLYPNEFQYEKGMNEDLLTNLNETFGHEILPIPNRRCILSAVSKDSNGLYSNTDYRKGGSIDGE